MGGSGAGGVVTPVGAAGAGVGSAIATGIGGGGNAGALGLTTAINYALSGLIDWLIAGAFLLGGIGGGLVGMKAALRLATHKQLLSRIFAGVLFVVAVYMAVRSASGFF